MKKLTIGLLAHVDAGKTTLAEAMLYLCGSIRKQGRVDHKDTVMDYHPLEQERGITIFTGQAQMTFEDTIITLMDTPGHVDFCAETERTLQILDYAILVISGTNGVQAHTLTLWQLLSHYHVPTFVFVTKMDFVRRSKSDLMAELIREFGPGCVDFSEKNKELWIENVALCHDDLLNQYMSSGLIEPSSVAEAITLRRIFPCYFGSGLKLFGITDFLEGLTAYSQMPVYPNSFGARIFKISRDEKNSRLTHIKMTGGSLQVRESIDTGKRNEKVSQIRVLNGKKYEPVLQALPGDIVALTGLEDSYGGQGLGYELLDSTPVFEPVMTYRITFPKECDPQELLSKLRLLEEEDPQLKVTWHVHQQEIHIGLMGNVQTEIIKSLIHQRFGVDVTIDAGRVLYKETIENMVEGVGHYEPLRHYAEVHLLLTPLPLGSGLVFDSMCSEDLLDRNWQRLILTHLGEKTHLGVLTGSPITDLRITLVSGKAHTKHTEGGDFRQATYRAVRQGLMQAKSKLLEPYYDFRIEVPTEVIGRTISDIQAMFGTFENPTDLGGMMQIKGLIPVSTIDQYSSNLASYTGGRGRLFLSYHGYGLCHDPESVLEKMQYDPEKDLENSADSIFCSHGGGTNVKWSLVQNQMHLPSFFLNSSKTYNDKQLHQRYDVSDQEMEAIMERLYGKPKETQTLYQPRKTYTELLNPYVKTNLHETVIVDGYNVIFAWDSLKALAQNNLSDARSELVHILSNYAATEDCTMILVFDGGKQSGNVGESQEFQGITVVYTKENQTADAYIEHLIHEMKKDEQIRIVTSDGLIQLAAVHKGALRVSAREFEAQVIQSNEHISTILSVLKQQFTGQSLKDQIHIDLSKEK